MRNIVNRKGRAKQRSKGFFGLSWAKAKKLFPSAAQDGVSAKWDAYKRTTTERSLTTSSPIGAIVTPIALGMLCATPALASGWFALNQATLSGDSLKLLAIFSAMNVTACVSGFMFTISRHWAEAGQLEELKKQLVAVRVTVDELNGAIEAEARLGHRNGRKDRDVPRTWRGLCGYLAVNPRFLKEVEIRATGDGAFRLTVSGAWIEMWVDRLRNPELETLEVVLFVDRQNPLLAAATGRTLVRFAKLIDAIVDRSDSVDLSKLKIYLVESAEVQRSFFIVRRKVAGRVIEMVLQYSRSIEEDGNGAITDIEAVERISEGDEMEKYHRAASRYLRDSRSTSAESIRTVFRDVLSDDTFAALTPSEWQERIEAIYNGVTYAQRQKFDIIETGSEFQIANDAFPWELRKREAELNEPGVRVRSADA